MARAFKILICDDDDGARQVLCDFLTQAGADVAAVDRAAKAITALESGGIDMVFMDLSMPEMTGDEALEKIKANPALRHIPIVILTGDEDVKKVSRCLRLGASEYLVKPVDGQTLVNLIRKLLVDARGGRRSSPIKVPAPGADAKSSAGALDLGPEPVSMQAEERDVEAARRELLSLLVMVHPVLDTYHLRLARFLARSPSQPFLRSVSAKLTEMQITLKDLAALTGHENDQGEDEP